MKTKMWQIGLVVSVMVLSGLAVPALGQMYADTPGGQVGMEGDGKALAIYYGAPVDVYFPDGCLAGDPSWGTDITLTFTGTAMITVYGYNADGVFQAVSWNGSKLVDLYYYLPGLAGGICGFRIYSLSSSEPVVLDAVRADNYTCTNTAPVAADDAAQTEAGVPVTIDVLGNDHDDDGDPLSVESVGAATNGSTTVNTDNTVTYTPDPGFTGLDQFTYTISDGKGGTSEATVFVTVSPRNVLIDIKPGSYPNSINLGSNGVVPVAILSEAGFDATTVDPATVSLAGASVAMRGKGNRLMANNEDVNGDGLLDLVLQIETENLDPAQLQAGYGTVVGTTYDGAPIIGSDEINIVPQ